MKNKCIFNVQLLLVLAAGCLYQSISHANNYLLTMSKNDEFCQHMYQMFNGDLRKKGRLVLEDHEEFNWLKWDKQFFMIKRHGDKEPNFDDKLIRREGYMEKYDSYTKFPKKGAFFDIDNNGRDEFVTFERIGAEYFQHRAYDKIAIYWGGNPLKKLSKVEITEQSNPGNGFLAQFLSKYVLKEYPIRKVTISQNGKVSRSWQKIFDPFIRPLKFEETFYIALFGNASFVSDPKITYPQTIDEKDGIAVIQFTPTYDTVDITHRSNLFRAGQPYRDTQDICYFVKTQVIQQGEQ